LSSNDFIAISKQMIEVKKLVNLIKGIKVNTLIVGESGSGKSRIAESILPNGVILDGQNTEDVVKNLKNFNEVTIENFDKIRNYDILHIQNQKIVATATKKPKESVVDKFFGVVIDLEPLSQRASDIPALTEYFLQEAKKELKLDLDLEAGQITADIQDNCHSLKRAVYKQLLLSGVDESSLISIMEAFFYERCEIDDNYGHFCDMFDRAVIEANHRKFKSQLMMSFKMGINRNTLRKKINELGINFND
jgi:DNA-binding NtrC family response regulator